MANALLSVLHASSGKPWMRACIVWTPRLQGYPPLRFAEPERFGQYPRSGGRDTSDEDEAALINNRHNWPGDTLAYPMGTTHISRNLDGVREYATLMSVLSLTLTGKPKLAFEKSSAGVNSDTLITLSLRWVALSVIPHHDRTSPAKHSMKTSAIA